MSLQYVTRYNDDDDDSEFEYQDDTVNILETTTFNPDCNDDDDDEDDDDGAVRASAVSKPFRKIQFTEATSTYTSKPLHFVPACEDDAKENQMREVHPSTANESLPLAEPKTTLYNYGEQSPQPHGEIACDLDEEDRTQCETTQPETALSKNFDMNSYNDKMPSHTRMQQPDLHTKEREKLQDTAGDHIEAELSYAGSQHNVNLQRGDEDEEEDEDDNETLMTLMQRQSKEAPVRKPNPRGAKRSNSTGRGRGRPTTSKNSLKNMEQQAKGSTARANRRNQRSKQDQNYSFNHSAPSAAATTKKNATVHTAVEDVITIDSDSSNPSPLKQPAAGRVGSNFRYRKNYPKSSLLTHYSPPRNDTISPVHQDNQDQQQHQHYRKTKPNVLNPAQHLHTCDDERTQESSRSTPAAGPGQQELTTDATWPPENQELDQLQKERRAQVKRILSLDKDVEDAGEDEQLDDENDPPFKRRRFSEQCVPAASTVPASRNKHRRSMPSQYVRKAKPLGARSIPPPPSSVQMPTPAPQPPSMQPPLPMPHPSAGMFLHPHHPPPPHPHVNPHGFPVHPMFYPGSGPHGMLPFPHGYAMPPPPFHPHHHPLPMHMPPHPHLPQNMQPAQQPHQMHQQPKPIPPGSQAAALYRAASVVTPGGSGPVSKDNAWPSFVDQTAPDGNAFPPPHNDKRSNSSSPPSAEPHAHYHRDQSQSPPYQQDSSKAASTKLSAAPLAANAARASSSTISAKPDAPSGLQEPPAPPLKIEPTAPHSELPRKIADNPIKASAKTDTVPKPPVACSKSPDDDAEASDEEPGADYISVITQKNSKATEIAGIKWAFEQVSGPSLRWKCILTGKLVPFKEGDELLERSRVGRTKSVAKHKAAKNFCQALTAIMKARSAVEPNQSEKRQDDIDKKGKQSVIEDQANNDYNNVGANNSSKKDNDLDGANIEDIRNAVNIITALWQSGRVESEPKYGFEMCGDRWKCFLTLKVSGAPDSITCTAVAQSKKGAKHSVSYKTFLKLRELKVPGIETYERFQSKQSDAPDAKKIRSVSKRSTAKDSAIGISVKKIVVNSDDELAAADGMGASCGGGISGAAHEKDEPQLGGASKQHCLSFPSGFQLTIARTEAEVDAWMNDNVSCPGSVGVYIDSQVGRAAVWNDATRLVEALDDRVNGLGDCIVSLEPIEWPIICVSTDEAAVLLSNKWRSDNDKRARTDTINVHGDQGAFKFWTPDSLLDVFESSQVMKNGCLYSVGLNDIQEDIGPKFRNFNELTSISVALTGVGKLDGSHFDTSLASLTKTWLDKRWPDVSSVKNLLHEGTDGSEEGLDFSKIEIKQIADSILSSFVCFKLSSAWRAEEKRKRANLRGPIDLHYNTSRFFEGPE